MKRFLATLCASGVALSLVGATVVPAASQSRAQYEWQQQQQLERMHRRANRHDRREFRRENRQDWREFRREARQDRREFRRLQRRGDRYYYNGYRGYRYHRPGYREVEGWWFPAAAFALGAIVGSTATVQPAPVYGGNAHVQWCYDRYRSYRASDNTFQPYDGPRQQCYSPYS